MSLQGNQLYIDGFSGIAGDMMLGALLDLGVPQEVVREGLRRLPIHGYRIDAKRATRCGITAIDLKVLVDGRGDHDHAHHRWSEIRTWLGDLEPAARDLAHSIFARLVRAEAKIHGTSEDNVEFHEVGAIDSVVDIAGTAIALAWLAPTKVTARAVPLGHGFTMSAHGRIPVPSPAALEILHEVPTEDGGVAMELTTPTGAAIVAALCSDFGPTPSGRSIAIGYGAGDKDLPERPNVLRLILFQAAGTTTDTVVQIEANLDDMSPEWCGPLLETLLSAGARDAWYEPITMKKGRPALKLSVLCEEAARELLTRKIFLESTTIGLRYWTVERKMLDRVIRTVATKFGPIEIKEAREGARILNVAPEYESCRKAADAHATPLKEVYAEAISASRRE